MKKNNTSFVPRLLMMMALLHIISGTDAAHTATMDDGIGSFDTYNTESSGGGSGSSSWLNLGTAHGVLGYTAIAAGLVSMGTGGRIAHEYDIGETPSSSLSSLHAGSSGAAAGLAIAACVTGLLAYGGVFDLNSGFNTCNSHIVLGLLATIGFIAAMVTGPAAEEGEMLAEDDYIGHCRAAQVSGVMMFASVIVIQF